MPVEQRIADSARLIIMTPHVNGAFLNAVSIDKLSLAPACTAYSNAMEMKTRPQAPLFWVGSIPFSLVSPTRTPRANFPMRAVICRIIFFCTEEAVRSTWT